MKHHVMTRTRNFCDRDKVDKRRVKLPSVRCLPDMVAEVDARRDRWEPTEDEISEIVSRFREIEYGLARKT